MTGKKSWPTLAIEDTGQAPFIILPVTCSKWAKRVRTKLTPIDRSART